MNTHFRIVAVPDPQTLPRIMGVFAQRTLVPTTLSSQLRHGMLHIETALNDLDAPTAAIIAAKLGEGVLVASVVCDPADEAVPASDAAMPNTVAAASTPRGRSTKCQRAGTTPTGSVPS